MTTKLIAAGLGGASALLAFCTTMAAASAAASGTIRLQGTVAAACTVAVTDAGASLDITNGASAANVGTVVENCNTGTGYTVTLSSANSGYLKSPANGTSPIGYTVNYDGQSAALTRALAVTRSAAQFNKSVAVTVSVPAAVTAIAGTYSDTLTVSIAAK